MKRRYKDAGHKAFTKAIDDARTVLDHASSRSEDPLPNERYENLSKLLSSLTMPKLGWGNIVGVEAIEKPFDGISLIPHTALGCPTILVTVQGKDVGTITEIQDPGDTAYATLDLPGKYSATAVDPESIRIPTCIVQVTEPKSSYINGSVLCHELVHVEQYYREPATKPASLTGDEQLLEAVHGVPLKTRKEIEAYELGRNLLIGTPEDNGKDYGCGLNVEYIADLVLNHGVTPDSMPSDELVAKFLARGIVDRPL